MFNNTIVDPGLSAISLNGVLYDANTLRSNTIKKSAAWPEIEGNPKPEDAIQLGPSLPDAFVDFLPAKVTAISGLSVSGTSGDSSSCPNCVVEVFLDDADGIVEVLQSLAVVTADGDGNWATTLPFVLSPTQGLRTTSTTARYNTIPNMSADTTTGLFHAVPSGRQGFSAVRLALTRKLALTKKLFPGVKTVALMTTNKVIKATGCQITG